MFFFPAQERSPRTGRASPATGGAGEGAGGAPAAVLQWSLFLLNGQSEAPSDPQALKSMGFVYPFLSSKLLKLWGFYAFITLDPL